MGGFWRREKTSGKEQRRNADAALLTYYETHTAAACALCIVQRSQMHCGLCTSHSLQIVGACCIVQSSQIHNTACALCSMHTAHYRVHKCIAHVLQYMHLHKTSLLDILTKWLSISEMHLMRSVGSPLLLTLFCLNQLFGFPMLVTTHLVLLNSTHIWPNCKSFISQHLLLSFVCNGFEKIHVW